MKPEFIHDQPGKATSASDVRAESTSRWHYQCEVRKILLPNHPSFIGKESRVDYILTVSKNQTEWNEWSGVILDPCISRIRLSWSAFDLRLWDKKKSHAVWTLLRIHRVTGQVHIDLKQSGRGAITRAALQIAIQVSSNNVASGEGGRASNLLTAIENRSRCFHDAFCSVSLGLGVHFFVPPEH